MSKASTGLDRTVFRNWNFDLVRVQYIILLGVPVVRIFIRLS